MIDSPTKFVYHLQVLSADLEKRKSFEDFLKRILNGVVLGAVTINKEEYGHMVQFHFEMDTINAMRALPKLTAFIDKESADGFLPLSLALITNPHYQVLWEYTQYIGDDGQLEFTTSIGPGSFFLTKSTETRPTTKPMWSANQSNNLKVRQLRGLLSDEDC